MSALRLIGSILLGAVIAGAIGLALIGWVILWAVYFDSLSPHGGGLIGVMFAIFTACGAIAGALTYSDLRRP